MKKIFTLIFLFFVTIANSQPIPHPGWPVRVYPFRYSGNYASCVIKNSESIDAEIILKGGNRIVGYSLNGQISHYYSAIQIEGLKGFLVALNVNNDLVRYASITQTFYGRGGYLIVGDSTGSNIYNQLFDSTKSIENPYSFDINGDNNTELLFVGDSIYCFNSDFTHFANFPISFNGDQATAFSGLAIGRIPGINSPILAYQLRDSLYLRQLDNQTSFTGFPIYLPANQYQSAPVFYNHSSGLYLYAHHQNNMSGRLKCISQNGQIIFDYGVGGGAQANLCITLLDIEGDEFPEVIVTYNSRIPMVYTWNGGVISLQDTLSSHYNGMFSSVVGYRPPNQQTLWFYALALSDTALFLQARQGTQVLPGFPIRVTLDTGSTLHSRISLSPTLTLIPPYNDTLRIIIGNSIDFMMYDFPCPSGGVMEVETARFDYGRSGFYQPRTIPYSWINRPFKGELPKNHRMKVFPNPTNAQFTIYFQQDSPKKLIIYNSMGRSVGSILTHNQSMLNFDASHLSAGSYFIADEYSNSLPITILK